MSILQIVRGRAGSGKSTYLIEQIKKNLHDGDNAIMLVPDQFSFAAEKLITQNFGGTGTNGIEVLTFNRLIHRMVKTDREYIKPAGKQMLLYKAVENIKKENSIFEKSLSKSGFLDTLAGIISEMKRYNVDNNVLSQQTEKMPDGMLKRKLDAITKIYTDYTDMFSGELLDSEDDFARLAQAVSDSDNFENTHIYIDEFTDFLPQVYPVISALMRKAKSMTAALCLDDFIAEFSIFSPAIKTLDHLRQLAKDTGTYLADEVFTSRFNTKNRFANPELAFLEHEWDNNTIYDKPINNISTYTAIDPYTEIEHTAIEILRLVREENYRFRDISILCADLENYSHLIEVLFKAYNIPYFTDKKVPLTDHPIILLILSVFDVFANGFDYESMITYLRTGYSNVTDEEIDLIENYIIERGIRGKKAWFSENDWDIKSTRIFDDVMFGEKNNTAEEKNVIDDIRRRIAAPFIQFDSNFDGKKTIRQLCTALFEFLDKSLSFVASVKKQVNDFLAQGNMDEAEQYRQIWKILIDVLDQLVTVMGDDYCGMERFYEILKTGLSQYEIGIIPSSVDMVAVGNADRSRTAQMKVLFVMGASYGKLPNMSVREGILSDNDRHILSKYGIELAPDTKTQLFDSQFKVYKSITKVSDKLFVSYSNANSGGEAQNPSQFILDIKRMFPQMQNTSSPLSGSPISPNLAVAPKPAFAHMVTALTSPEKPVDDTWDKVYNWYKNHDEYKNRLHVIDDAKKNFTAHLTRERAQKLYAQTQEYSASRLEKFAECPFKYFVSYGLSASERNSWQVQAFDIGSLMHYILKCFCEKVEEGKTDNTYAGIKAAWHKLDEDKINEIINDLLNSAHETILKRDMQGKGRIKFLLSQIENTLRESAKIIYDSITQGEFTPIAYEQDFSKFKLISSSDKHTLLRGQIDRIDLIEDSDKVYIRIIDYKSGSKSFNLNDIYNNFSMQLVIYAQAAIELYKDGKLTNVSGKPVNIAGILYSSLKDDIAKENPPIDEQTYSPSFKFNGLLLNDGNALHYMDKDYSDKSAGFTSEFFPFKTKKDGELYSNSSVATAENFDTLGKFVSESINDINTQIHSGDISIRPYFEKSKNVCTFCPYGEICRFDAGKHKKRYAKTFGKGNSPWDCMNKVLDEKEDK